MTTRWIPWCINATTSGTVGGKAPPHMSRFCVVLALGGQLANDRFPWVATLCGDQPRLTSPVYFGARPPAPLPVPCRRCAELLAEQDGAEVEHDTLRDGKDGTR